MSEDGIERKAGEFIAELGNSAITVATNSELLEKVPFVSHIAKAFSLKEAFIGTVCRGTAKLSWTLQEKATYRH